MLYFGHMDTFNPFSSLPSFINDEFSREERAIYFNVSKELKGLCFIKQKKRFIDEMANFIVDRLNKKISTNEFFSILLVIVNQCKN